MTLIEAFDPFRLLLSGLLKFHQELSWGQLKYLLVTLNQWKVLQHHLIYHVQHVLLWLIYSLIFCLQAIPPFNLNIIISPKPVICMQVISYWLKLVRPG